MVCLAMNYYLVKDKFMFGYFSTYLYILASSFFKEGLHFLKMALIFKPSYNVFKRNIWQSFVSSLSTSIPIPP